MSVNNRKGQDYLKNGKLSKPKNNLVLNLANHTQSIGNSSKRSSQSHQTGDFMNLRELSSIANFGKKM